MHFQNQVVVVTGASEGIGRELCLCFAKQRAKVVLAARNEARLRELASLCRDLGAEPLVVPTDVANQDSCRRLVAATIAQFGRLDVLVNNAGIGSWATLEETRDLTLYEQTMRVNYLGSVYCTYYALPHLKQSRGRIVAMSSVAGLVGVPMYTAYAATKHAMFGFFDSLRIELLDTGVTVTVIAPDFVASTIHGRSLGPDGTPLGKSPRAEGGFMPADECARRILKAIERRKRQFVMSFRGRWASLGKRFAPRLLDRLAQRANRREST